MLARVRFRRIQEGTTVIEFENLVNDQAPVKLADDEGNLILVTWEGGELRQGIVLAGDANGDGSVNDLDITKVARMILLLDAQIPGADANQDGVVNVLDMTKVARIILMLD